MHRLQLRWLILILMTAIALVIYGIGVYASNQVLADQLIENTLEGNRAYAVKLARTADGLLAAGQSQMAASAEALSGRLDDQAFVQRETARLMQQTSIFNAVYVVRSNGVILAGLPEHLHLAGVQLVSPGGLLTLNKQVPLISPPYVSMRNNLVVMVSHPVRDSNGQYQGFVGGSIYLDGRNTLHTLLGTHYRTDGSYLYVVDADHRVIYHPDKTRIGETVLGNEAVEAVIAGKEGARRIVNSKGIEMLAGYSPIARTGWGIVAQRPVEATLAPLGRLEKETLRRTAPFVLPVLLLLWWLSGQIVRPLRQLAATAKQLESAASKDTVRNVHTWYDEAEQLKQALLEGLISLHQKLAALNEESLSDPLTGLSNRRGMHGALAQWQAQSTPFSVIAIEVDHLRSINAQHGYEVGNQVIRHAARIIESVAHGNDLACRVAGKKFLLFLPKVDIDSAAQIAERLRLWTGFSDSPTGSPITVSAGVTAWPGGDASVPETLKRADEALYQAKREGLNRVVVRAADGSKPLEDPDAGA